MPTLLVRYGELGLKSASVRRRFENALVEDLRRKHALAMTPCVISTTRGRVFVDSDDWRKSCEILSRTFGVVSFSPVEKAGSGFDELKSAVREFARPILFGGAAFAIRPRRTGNHAYTSQVLARELGAAVLDEGKEKGVRVSLEQPDVEIFVEVREKDAYLFSSVLPGPGGMPYGTQGRMLCVVDSEMGIASAWLMMKRGCTPVVLASERRHVEPLERWSANLKVVFSEEDIFSAAKSNGCLGISLSWRLEQIEKNGWPKGDLPVFYPLVGMTEEEVRRLIDRICS
jgi:thiamine biosynthesis protein ThiI